MAEFLAAPVRWFLELVTSAVDHDFSRYDAYLDTQPVLFLREEGRKVTATLQVQPPRQDTGTSEFETRTEFGNFFAQGDFSHGAGQRFFHRPTRDDAKYLHAEGFDITEPGVLRHLNDTAEADNTNLTDPVALAEFDDLPFVAQADDVYAGNGAFPGIWTIEDPQAGEAAANVLDIASGGDRLYAAIGVNGIHHRTTAGVWDHLATSTPTDVDTGDTRLVRWLKDRLMVVGAAGRAIYEVVVVDGVASNATPTAIETVGAGWEFTEIWEAGAFIFAACVNVTSGLSRVHAYGLNSGATAIEKKSSTPMPKGTLIYTGCGTQGRIFLAGGRQNRNAGLNACLFEAAANDTGELQFFLIESQDDDDASDFATRRMEVLHDSIVFGWGRGNNSIFGRFIGLAKYNLARNAFSFHLNGQTSADRKINDVISYRDRLLFCVDNDGLLYEKLGTPIATAYIITSVADWFNASMKVWDLFQITHEALDVGESIAIQYTKKNPDEEDWQDAFTSSTPGSPGAEARLEDIEARAIALKITSTTGATTEGAAINSFAVRSVPSPQNTEWRLLRTVRVFDEDRKDPKAEAVHQDPRTMRAQIQDLAHTWLTVYEPGVAWVAYVEDVAEVEPGNPVFADAAGTSEREAYFLELRMVARRAA